MTWKRFLLFFIFSSFFAKPGLGNCNAGFDPVRFPRGKVNTGWVINSNAELYTCEVTSKGKNRLRPTKKGEIQKHLFGLRVYEFQASTKKEYAPIVILDLNGQKTAIRWIRRKHILSRSTSSRYDGTDEYKTVLITGKGKPVYDEKKDQHYLTLKSGRVPVIDVPWHTRSPTQLVTSGESFYVYDEYPRNKEDSNYLLIGTAERLDENRNDAKPDLLGWIRRDQTISWNKNLYAEFAYQRISGGYGLLPGSAIFGTKETAMNNRYLDSLENHIAYPPESPLKFDRIRFPVHEIKIDHRKKEIYKIGFNGLLQPQSLADVERHHPGRFPTNPILFTVEHTKQLLRSAQMATSVSYVVPTVGWVTSETPQGKKQIILKVLIAKDQFKRIVKLLGKIVKSLEKSNGIKQELSDLKKSMTRWHFTEKGKFRGFMKGIDWKDVKKPLERKKNRSEFFKTICKWKIKHLNLEGLLGSKKIRIERKDSCRPIPYDLGRMELWFQKRYSGKEVAWISVKDLP